MEHQNFRDLKILFVCEMMLNIFHLDANRIFRKATKIWYLHILIGILVGKIFIFSFCRFKVEGMREVKLNKIFVCIIIAFPVCWKCKNLNMIFSLKLILQFSTHSLTYFSPCFQKFQVGGIKILSKHRTAHSKWARIAKNVQGCVLCVDYTSRWSWKFWKQIKQQNLSFAHFEIWAERVKFCMLTLFFLAT